VGADSMTLRFLLLFFLLINTFSPPVSRGRFDGGFKACEATFFVPSNTIISAPV
jgi:hypothetical protein